MISSHFDNLSYFTPDFPRYQIMDSDTRPYVKFWKLQKWVWLAKNDFFHERRHTRSFLQSFKWFQAILTIYHTSPRISPDTKSWIRTLDHRWNFENSKNEFDWLKMIFFMKEGIRDHFCRVSSDFKLFWQFIIFHRGFPQIPNHGFGH